MILNEKIKKYVFLFAKITIAIVAFYFIFQKISIQPWAEIKTRVNIMGNNSFFILIPIILLSVFNWMAESLKWQILSTAFKPISYTDSFKIVLSSFAVSTITPNRVGEYGAKILYYNKMFWKEVLSYNFLGNMMQLLVTLVMVIANFFFIPDEVLQVFPKIGFISVLILSILIMFFIFLPKIEFSLPWISKNVDISLWNKINMSLKTKVFVISAFRYFAFSFQFLLILSLFGYKTSFVYFSIITLYYLIVSVVPTIFISDLLVKGSVSIFLFSLVSVDEITMVAVVMLAWFFNFALPTLVGSILLFKKN